MNQYFKFLAILCVGFLVDIAIFYFMITGKVIPAVAYITSFLAGTFVNVCLLRMWFQKNALTLFRDFVYSLILNSNLLFIGLVMFVFVTSATGLNALIVKILIAIVTSALHFLYRRKLGAENVF